MRPVPGKGGEEMNPEMAYKASAIVRELNNLDMEIGNLEKGYPPFSFRKQADQQDEFETKLMSDTMEFYLNRLKDRRLELEKQLEEL